MCKERIKLTESELRYIIREAVEQELNEMDMDEGWFGDKWKQAKSAYTTATQGGEDYSLKDRLTNAKANWGNQGQINDYRNLIKNLKEFAEANKIDPQTTIADMIGGKFRNPNASDSQYGKIGNRIANKQKAIKALGGKRY